MNDISFFNKDGKLEESLQQHMEELVDDLVTKLVRKIPHASKQPHTSQIVLRYLVTQRVDLMLTIALTMEVLNDRSNWR